MKRILFVVVALFLFFFSFSTGPPMAMTAENHNSQVHQMNAIVMTTEGGNEQAVRTSRALAIPILNDQILPAQSYGETRAKYNHAKFYKSLAFTVNRSGYCPLRA